MAIFLQNSMTTQLGASLESKAADTQTICNHGRENMSVLKYLSHTLFNPKSPSGYGCNTHIFDEPNNNVKHHSINCECDIFEACAFNYTFFCRAHVFENPLITQ